MARKRIRKGIRIRKIKIKTKMKRMTRRIRKIRKIKRKRIGKGDKRSS
jgi:hypothetical protein